MLRFSFVWKWPGSTIVAGEESVEAESAEKAALKFLTNPEWSQREIVATWGGSQEAAEQAQALDKFLKGE